MQVVLLERVAKLGQMGDVVTVKPGYGRNYLLPQGKALRASKENMARFEQDRAQLEARNLERRQEAERVGETLDGSSYVVIRQAAETGQLYGSVSARDIAEAVTEGGTTVEKRQIALDQPIKALGLHEVGIALHAEVEINVTVNVARSEEEAELQAQGVDIMAMRDADDDDDWDDDDDAPAPEDIFEEGEGEPAGDDAAEAEASEDAPAS